MRSSIGIDVAAPPELVYRLARERQLRGWVHNSSHGVVIEVEGERAQLDDFRDTAANADIDFIKDHDRHWRVPCVHDLNRQ